MRRVRGITLALVAAALLGGCGGDTRDPSRPLSADEGAALLKDIRSDSRRMQSLTPAEKKYLLETLKK